MATPEEQIPAASTEEAGTQSSSEPVAPPPPTTLPDIESMPEELRGMPIEQFKGAWEVMRQVHAAQTYMREAPPAPPPPPADDRPFQERFEEDPERALDEYVQLRYGPQMETLAQSGLEGIIASMRAEIPDFKSYEKSTRETIKRLGVPATQVSPTIVRYAYLITRGEADEAEALKPKSPPPEAVTTEVPVKQPDKAPEVELQPHQREIASRLFGPGPEGEKKYKEWAKKGASGYQTMSEVPLEKKDYGKPTAAK